MFSIVIIIMTVLPCMYCIYMNVVEIQLPKDCLLWSSLHLEMVTFSYCIAPFRWLENMKPYWPQLKHLHLPCTSKTSDHDLIYLAAMKNLNLRQEQYNSYEQQSADRDCKCKIQPLGLHIAENSTMCISTFTFLYGFL